jgi:signal transduction histidine kinase
VRMDSQTHVTIDKYAGTMLDHVSGGVALFDARDLRLLAANKLFYRFFETHYVPSCDAETFIGHTLIEGLSAADPTDAAALIAIFRDVAETGIPYQTEECTAPVLNRDQMYWDWSLHPVCNEHGQIIRLIFHGSDVTAHMPARQQAEQAHTSLTHAHSTSEMARKRLEVIEIERQKNAFLSLVSHELRTPLTAIMGFAELLQLKDAQEEGLDPMSRRAISQIIAQSVQLTRLINAMFDLTRLENAELSLDCDVHDLHATLKEAIESQEITARGHCIRMVSKRPCCNRCGDGVLR